METNGADRVFRFRTYEELMAMPSPEVQVDGLIRHGDIGMIYGEDSASRFAAVSLAQSAATGAPFADQFGINRPLSVIYMKDGDTKDLSDYFQALDVALTLKERNPSHENVLFYNSIPSEFLTREDTDGFVTGWEERVKTGKQKPVDIAFVDSPFVSDTQHRTPAQIWKGAKQLQESMNGCTMVLVSWVKKRDIATGLIGASDFILCAGWMGWNANKCRVRVDKLRDFPPPVPRWFELPVEANRWR